MTTLVDSVLTCDDKLPALSHSQTKSQCAVELTKKYNFLEFAPFLPSEKT